MIENLLVKLKFIVVHLEVSIFVIIFIDILKFIVVHFEVSIFVTKNRLMISVVYWCIKNHHRIVYGNREIRGSENEALFLLIVTSNHTNISCRVI